MAKNRIKSGIVSTEKLISELYEAVREHGWSREDVTDVIRATINEPDTALSRWDKTRQAQLNKELAEYQRRIDTGDFSPKPQRAKPLYTRETLAAQKRVEELKSQYNKMLYRATRSTGEKIADKLAKAANVPKTIKSIGDISAVLRQGGFYAITHPITGGVKPFREMVRSFTEAGFRNVEEMIKNDPDFRRLKEAGVEFTGIDKADPRLSKHEEGYLGGEYLDYVPVAKQVKDFSERTFVSFLDAQRLFRGKQMLEGLTEAQRRNPAELKAFAKLINAATGRGNLGRHGNQAAPLLNIGIFSPRLLVSRIQLLNNMINPVTMARMPAGARKAMIMDNAKFIGATFAALSLAKAAGATVSLDPDDSEFLKVRVGDTVYDTLTGMQQPLRYIINMLRAATEGETYPGESKSDLSKKFARSKLSPLGGSVIDYLSNEDFQGRKFSWKNEGKDLITPLPAKDIVEGFQQAGLVGAVKATPTLVGVGVGSYPTAPEKPHTQAEKLARKMIRENMPPSEPREQEEIDADRLKAQLRARSRRGEDVSSEIAALGTKLTERQTEAILSARNKTRLQEDVNRLSAEDALLVYSVATPAQRAELNSILTQKSATIDTMAPERAAKVRQAYESAGFKRGTLPRERKERSERPERRSRDREGYLSP